MIDPKEDKTSSLKAEIAGLVFLALAFLVGLSLASHHAGALGLPILDDAVAAFECGLDAVHDVGDHSIFIGRVEAAEDIRKPALPLLYFRGRYLRIERAASAELLGKPEK